MYLERIRDRENGERAFVAKLHGAELVSGGLTSSGRIGGRLRDFHDRMNAQRRAGRGR